VRKNLEKKIYNVEKNWGVEKIGDFLPCGDNIAAML
jgi:hypothetical protein